MKKTLAAEAAKDTFDEISALVRQLDQTQRRLQDLAGDELDAVLHPGGRSYLLHEAQEKLRASETHYHSLFENMLEGCAYCQLVYEGTRAVDYTYISINRTFEAQTGLRDVVGRKVSEVVPGMHEANPEQLEIYSRVAETGRPEQFETHAKQLGIWFAVSTYSIEPKHFVVVFENITERKLAEQSLRASEELARQSTLKLAKVLDSSLDVICTFDAEGRFIQVSAACERVWGYRSEELLGTPFMDKVHEDDREKTRAVDANILSGVATIGFENRYVRKDGSIVDMMWSASWSEVEQSNFCVAHDITERKKAEASLVETSALLNSLLQNTEDYIYFKDLDSRLVHVSKIFLSHLRLSDPSEVRGKTDFDFYLEEHARAALATEQEIIRTGEPVGNLEEKETHLDGRVTWVLTSKMPWRDSAGKLLGTVGISKDITDRKQAEELLLESQQRLTLATKSAHIGIWDWDLVADKMYWDPQMMALYGIREEDFDGQGNSTWQKCLHPEDREKAEADMAFALRNEGEFHFEFRVIWPSGEVHHLESHALLKRAKNGTAERMIGINWDVTERKKLEQQFLRSQRMEGIGTLAGGIAHDLNNMLAPIIMSIELLKMKFQDADSQHLISIISSSAQRGADMVSQVLSFARGVEGRRIEVQVKNLLQDLEKLANDTFQKNIQVRCVVPTDLWSVIGDPTQLHQVLLNLCVNARDAMPEGGVLTLSAENLSLDKHYAGLNSDVKPGPYVALQVEDSGFGMPLAVIEKIFDPFYTTKELGKGTGLGLSTTQAIVKSHGGFLRVYSEPGKGTKFRVYLPGTEERSEAALAAAEAAMPRGNGELILVVDDESSVRQITRQTLEAFGYRVILAGDGTEAIAIYATRSSEIDVVLTDMMMPLMDGSAMARVFFKLNPAIRIIAASGLTSNSQVLEMGVKYFLPKPYTADTLLKALRQILTSEV